MRQFDAHRTGKSLVTWGTVLTLAASIGLVLRGPIQTPPTNPCQSVNIAATPVVNADSTITTVAVQSDDAACTGVPVAVVAVRSDKTVAAQARTTITASPSVLEFDAAIFDATGVTYAVVVFD